MSNQKQHKNFGVADFERYHRGKMSREEMNAIEKAALEDPFLDDALQGYAYTTTPLQDIELLKQRFATKERKKIFSIYRGNPLLKIAAILIIVAGISWLLYPSNNVNSKLATAPEKEERLLAKNTPADAMMNAVPYNDDIKGVPANENAGTVKNETSVPVKKYETKIPREQLPELQKIGVSAPDIASAPVSAQMEMHSNAASAASNATYFNNKDSASMADVTVTTNKEMLGYDKMKQEDAQNVQEAYAINQATAIRQKKGLVSKSVSNVPGLQGIHSRVSLKNVIPVMGLTAFNKLVDDSLQTMAALKVMPVTGFVRLSFSLNETGRPLNVKVLQPLCSACDVEAIRFIRLVKWNYTTPEKIAEATIVFP